MKLKFLKILCDQKSNEITQIIETDTFIFYLELIDYVFKVVKIKLF